MRQLTGLVTLLLLVGAGCTPSAVKNTSVEPKNCGSDKACGEEIVRLCHPGKYGDTETEQYTINGSENGKCSVIVTLGGESSMTCLLPQSITTLTELDDYIGVNMTAESSECTGPLKDSFKNSYDTNEKKWAEENQRQSTTNKPLVTASDRDKERNANLDAIIKALERFTFRDGYYHGDYPDGVNVVLGSSAAACLNASGWQPKNCTKPFMAEVPSDPLPNYQYSYTLTKDKKSFTIDIELEGTLHSDVKGAVKKAYLTPDGTVHRK